jgi:hypothetical protein
VRGYKLDILRMKYLSRALKSANMTRALLTNVSSYGREAPVMFRMNLSSTKGQRLLRRASTTGRLNKTLQGSCLVELRKQPEAMYHTTPD